MECDINEQLVCRTCLASNSTGVRLYNLEEQFMCSMNDSDLHKDETSSFAECLIFCTRLDNVPNFPNFICEECSHALQIAYVFIQNALKAHDILAQQLGPATVREEIHNVKTTNEVAPIRFRCKICSQTVETKKELKEHIKLHMDVITYCCQMCDYDCKKRSQLSSHYSTEHNIEASVEQLKPYMQTDQKMEDDVKVEMISEIDEIICPSEERLKEQEEAERLLLELEEKLLKEQQEQNKTQECFAGGVDESKSDNTPYGTIDVEHTGLNTITTPTILDNFGNDVSVGSEFMVLPDGTVQKVVGSDVVIEYINQDVTVLESNNIVLENLIHMDTNNITFDPMVFDDIIEEAPQYLQSAEGNSTSNINQEEPQTQKEELQLRDVENVQKSAKIQQCKMCPKAFETQSDLKTHMLGHSEIPHFFCDMCSFYTFFKKDLTQHYRTQHNIRPSQRQLQPTNKGSSQSPIVGRAIYSCDLCLYESTIRINLQRHYTNEHNIQATEVQLRPVIDNTDVIIKGCSNVRTVKVVKPNGDDYIRCRICKLKFSASNKYEEHLLWHEKNDTKKEVRPENVQQDLREYVEMETSATNLLESCNNNINTPAIVSMDTVPQVIASEQTVEQTVNFDFNGDEIFEDFVDNNGSIGDGQDDDDLGDLFLTSEDDLDDLLAEHGNDDKMDGQTQSAPQLRAYCVHCNKRFFSQYHFENHMFIHRGLAPFRCEMCTNLYNTKRAIIRHYMAVHKTIPTRDMIQAKGDKMDADKTSVENLNMEGPKRCTLMCAKCPFESNSNDSKSLNNLLSHLNTIHGITDDNYILQKLPFECPRCIRSYESKASLMRHLERSHSTAIIQQSARQDTRKKSLSSSTFTTNSTATSPKSGMVDSSLKPVSSYSGDVRHKSNDNVDATALFENIQNFEFANNALSVKNETQEHTSLFQCSICQGKYKSALLLKHHFKRHVERKFLCDLCPKSFIVRTELDNHKMLHTGKITGEKPYKCDMCHKQFGYPHHLKRHKEGTHYGKRYTCSINTCGKSFTTKAQYNIHKLTHSGNLPYKCKICSRSFVKRESLRQHARNVHNINLTEIELAEIFRENMGHMNPHDLVVALDNGQMLRRSDAEAVTLGYS